MVRVGLQESEKEAKRNELRKSLRRIEENVIKLEDCTDLSQEVIDCHVRIFDEISFVVRLMERILIRL